MATPIKWRREAVLVLCEAYEQHPCLYDSSSSLYTNKSARDDALRRMKKSLREYIPKLSERDIKAKIHSVRSQFLAEWRKIKFDSNQSGASTEERMEPYWYSRLKFLESHVKVKDPNLSIKPKIEKRINDIPAAAESSSDEPDSEIGPDSPKKKEEDGDELPSYLVSAVETLNRATAPSIYEPVVEQFGELIKAELASITDTRLCEDLRMVLLTEIFAFKRRHNSYD